MFFAGFDWDEENKTHLSRHGVTPDEAEQVVEDEDLLYYHVGEERYLGYGQTAAGRYLTVIFAWRPRRVIRFVTARDMAQGERRLFRRRR